MKGRLFFLALMALSPVVIGSTVADEPEYARMPWHLVDLWWDLGEETPFQSYSIDVTVSEDVPSTTNLYIAPIGIAHLSKIPFYGGIQTQVDGHTKSDQRIRKIGPGFLMSMWGERSLNAIRPSIGGLCQSSGHEGDFVSVRRPYEWSKGTYTYQVVRMDEEIIDGMPYTWVGAFVYSHEQDENVFVGALRFKAEDLVLSQKVASLVEVYGHRIPVAEIPKVTVTFGDLKINGQAADVGAVEAVYPKGVPDYAEAIAEDGKIVIEVGEPVEDRTDRSVELDLTEDDIQNQAGRPSQMNRISGKTPLQILALLGAKGEDGVQPGKLEEYRRVFGFLDANDDGNLSTKEFVEDGKYLTRQARHGIFGASDANGDGVVSEQEYVINRIITDEAKAILATMDEDGDGIVTQEEFLGHSGLPKDLAQAVFSEFDTDGNSELVIPEYLRVWGRWARSKDSGQ